MKKDLQQVLLEIKTHKFMYIIPLVIIYCIFIPYCLSEIQYVTSPQEREIHYFMISQRYLHIFIIYYLWLLLRNYIDTALVETIISLDNRYRIRFVFYALLIYLIILIPYFVITYTVLDNCIYLIGGLVFQFVILSCMFYGLTLLSKNCLITLVSMIIFILLFTQFFIIEEVYILFYFTILTIQLPFSYWLCQVGIGMLMTILGLIIEKKKLYVS